MDAGGVFARDAPWTVEGWLELDLGDDVQWRQVEIDDGALLVNPPPTFEHDRAGSRLAQALMRAAPPAPLEVVVPAAAVLLRRRVRVPDLVVVRADLVPRRARYAPLESLVLAVEVESPSSRRRDRVQKPGEYATAGIPHYWRVELDGPAIVAYRLVDGAYVEVGRAEGEQALVVVEPFPVTVVPARLVP